MDWVETLNECWVLLNNELIKLNINSIDEFLQKIFVYLFPILNEHKNIDNYEKLLEFEEKLEIEIKKMIEKFKNEENNEQNKYNNINIYKNHFYFDFLKNKLTNKFQEKNPLYEYFYCSDYIDENYLVEKMKHMDSNKYPLLKKYLEHKRNTNKNEQRNFLLNNIITFNKALNLINQYYFNNITRKDAEIAKLKDTFIYINNKELIDNYIDIYNKFTIINNNKEKLSFDNPLWDFFISDDNNLGKAYNIIYEKLIELQNEELKALLDLKINEGIFDLSCKNKINIQNINEKDIFNLNLVKEQTFNYILFKYSYRKIIWDEKIKNKICHGYDINFDLIENEMTHILLKNKKLLNKDIIYFSYTNETFTNKITYSITSFKNRNPIDSLNIDDKLIIYEFYKGIENSAYSHKEMINDFIELIKFLNLYKEKNKVDEKSMKIFEIFNLKNDISYTFKKLFENRNEFTVDKTWIIFDYYSKLIYENVSKDLQSYQEKLSDISIKQIRDYFNVNHLISQKALANAIRLFITLVLFLEEDKENKIRNNCNNIINYLYEKDLWEKDIYNNEKEFIKNLNELKNFKISICNIISFYEALKKEIDDGDIILVENRYRYEEVKKKNILIGNDCIYDDNDNGNDIDDF